MEHQGCSPSNGHPSDMSYNHINGLVQDCGISNANTLEILQSCTKPSKLYKNKHMVLCLSSDGRRIQFILGADGEPWTWVMGEHSNDKTVDQLLEEDAKKKAAEQAEKEALVLR